MTASKTIRTGNLLLDAMPSDVRGCFVAASRVRRVDPGQTLAGVGEDVRETYFPTSATLSILAEPDEATTVEASTVGREGAADIFAALGALKSAQRLIGQVPGDVLALDTKVLRDEVAAPGRTQTLIFSYIQALYAQAAISAACNAKHHIEQRAARWLLQTHDRADDATFELKQEFLAFMLGAARPTVSLTAAALRAEGLLTYARGVVTICDRDGLEGKACSCYEQIRRQYSLLVQL